MYCVVSIILIAQDPGLQYDEALLALGSVHMLNSPGELRLPHDPDTWACAFGRCFPLMTVRYVSAFKEWVCLPFFAIFGSSAEALRLVNVAMGAVGIWGLGVLLRNRIGPGVAAATAFALAVHPAYVDLTVFDNGTVAIWMLSLGLLAIAVDRYAEREDPRSAFLLGAAMGFGVWGRANFAWMLLACGVAVLVLAREQFVRMLRSWLPIGLGGLFGGAVFLAYQIKSRGGTFEAVGMFSMSEPLHRRVLVRAVMLAETLLSDREHRAIWAGPEMPDWQRWLFPMLLVAGCAACLALARGAWMRAAPVVLLGLGALLFQSKLPVAEHHLIVLVPLAVATVCGAGAIVQERFRWGRWACAAAGAVYLVCALGWQYGAIRGIAETGGVGQWSDAVYPLAEHLEANYAGREIRILDWGLENNLFLLTEGRLRTREIYGDATRDRAANGRTWSEVIRGGGVYLMNGASNRQFPAASEGFLAALPSAGVRAKRFAVRQRNGEVFAEIFEIPPP